MAVIVVNEAEFGIVELTAPLEGLCDVSVGGHFTIGRVVVRGYNASFVVEQLTDILREIPAVGVPRAVFANSKGAGGDELGRIPEDVPDVGGAFGCQVAGCYLEVASVEIALCSVVSPLVSTFLVARRPMKS